MYQYRTFREADATAVSGYNDDTHVVMDGTGNCGIAQGVVEWFWQINKGNFRVFNIYKRAFAIHHFIGENIHGWNKVLVSADDRYLFLLQGLKTDESTRASEACLWKFDLETGDLVQRRAGLPSAVRALRMDDGKLLFERLGVLTRVDPSSLTDETDIFNFARISPPGNPQGLRVFGWTSCSPNGRYWVRFDHTHIEVREDRPAGVTGKAPFIGVSLQVWEAFPLKYRFTTPVCYQSIDELPDINIIRQRRMSEIHGIQGNFKFSPETVARALEETRAEREDIWRSLAEGANKPDRVPTAPFPPREAFNQRAQTDDAYWSLLLDAFAELQRKWSYHGKWQPDNEAVWLKFYRHPEDNAFVCISMDGIASPMMWIEKDVGEPWQVQAEPDRKLLVSARRGQLRLDGYQPRDSAHWITVTRINNESHRGICFFYEDSYYNRKMKKVRRSGIYKELEFVVLQNVERRTY